MRKNINMNKLDKIRLKINKIKAKKLDYSQRQEYYNLESRIEWLLNLEFFLSLREKIKKQVSENYIDSSIEQISSSIITCNDYGFVDYKDEWLCINTLTELIEGYVKCQFKNIESNTLKIEL
jgi:hypothetical protein